MTVSTQLLLTVSFAVLDFLESDTVLTLLKSSDGELAIGDPIAIGLLLIEARRYDLEETEVRPWYFDYDNASADMPIG